MGILDTILGKPQQPSGGLLSMLPDWLTGNDVKPVPIEQYQEAMKKPPEGYRQKIAREFAQKYGGGDPYKERAIYSTYTSAADFVPLLGEDVGVHEASEDISAGRYGPAALGMAGTLLGVAPVVGDVAATPFKAAAKSLRTAAKELPTGGLLKEVAKVAEDAPITAWHGSPNKFTKFDDTLTGTGAGSHFGRGHYLAENADIAREYGENVYKTSINAKPEAFLDFNKPLAEQSDAVKGGVIDLLDTKYGKGTGQAFVDQGSDFRDILNNFDDLDPVDVSKGLSERGIPGVKYLDQNSRAGKGGSHNYTVFDPNILEIQQPGGVMGEAAKEAGKAAPQGGLLSTVGDIKNPDVMFEGMSPGNFKDTAQWHRFGQAHGVENLGSPDTAAWEKSLVPYQTKSGKTFTVPGGVDSKDAFTYYDLLHLKQQGINPNDMSEAMHQKIHDRMVKTMSPEGEVSPERLFNQLSLAQISPNQPLTPNELAVARSMAKNPEDLKNWGEMVPWRHDDVETPKSIMKNDDGSDMMRTVNYTDKKTGEKKTKQVPVTMRKFYGDKIANDLGLGAGEKGGLGARGTADYTRIAETAQRIQDNPDFFRFRGAGEGASTSAGQWANFVERLTSQTPGLSAKTGSFGAVWQNPAMADISAVDRHMAGLFTEEMFPSKEAFNSFASEHVAKFNETAPKNKQVQSFKQLPDSYKNDAMFGYLNQHPDMVLRGKPPKGSNSGLGEVNPRVPAHLRPENADWVSDPKKVQLISDAYKRVLEANAQRANKAGQSTFSNQWMLWDRIRNRLEPHEIMFPGLEKLPRMSMDQMHEARQALTEAGYMSSAKGGGIDELTGEPTKSLAPVRPLPSASKAGYFGIAPLGLLPMLNQQAEDKPTTPDLKTRRRMRRREEA